MHLCTWGLQRHGTMHVLDVSHKWLCQQHCHASMTPALACLCCRTHPPAFHAQSTSACLTLANGARQLVVQDALETMWSLSGMYCSSLTPMTNIGAASSTECCCAELQFSLASHNTVQRAMSKFREASCTMLSCWLLPSADGAEMTTFLAPPFKCAEACNQGWCEYHSTYNVR